LAKISLSPGIAEQVRIEELRKQKSGQHIPGPHYIRSSKENHVETIFLINKRKFMNTS
jgi:hypothetical protein